MHRGPHDVAAPRSATAVCAAGLLSLALAMGVGRFAFTPLLPFMVRDGLLSGSYGAWLASANYLGYLVGALWAAVPSMATARRIRISLGGILALTIAMGWAGSMPAWLALRFAAGVLSAWALVATSHWALSALAGLGRPALAGIVYAGTGVGIAFAGAFCLVAATPSRSASELWQWLGICSLPIAVIAALLVGRGAEATAAAPHVEADARITRRDRWLVVCYAAFGFGYILPATFIPALAHRLVEDPRRFGLAWPLFGITSALSTVIAAAGLRRSDRLRTWAGCHVLMAAGAALPAAWRSLTAILLSALLVGGTFMVVTMVGLQEARARRPHAPAPLIARMTAAFAVGQIAGPLFVALLSWFSIEHETALELSLGVAALVLLATAAVLAWTRFEETRP